MTYKGSCHCGNIEFEAVGEIDRVIECNCSFCSKKGALHWMVPSNKFRLRTSVGNIGTYTFNKQVIEHHFCKNCGCAPYSERVDPSGKSMVAVNVRCIDDFDVSHVEVGHFDGRAL